MQNDKPYSVVCTHGYVNRQILQTTLFRLQTRGSHVSSYNEVCVLKDGEAHMFSKFPNSRSSFTTLILLPGHQVFKRNGVPSHHSLFSPASNYMGTT